MSMTYRYFASCPRGLEDLLAKELSGLGAVQVAPARAGVGFSGTMELGYQVCLWSRLASRLLLPVAHFPATTPAALYAGVQAVDWSEHLSVEATLAVSCNVSRSRLDHSHFAALKTKDAVVDQFRSACGRRPSVDVQSPDLRIDVYIDRNAATLSLNLSGESLHRRGYRAHSVKAPLKENLAAAMLMRAGWPEVAQSGGTLLDPVCGSGTLLIEAGLMAADIAPGLLRHRFGFHGWRQHDEALWQQVLQQARVRRRMDPAVLPAITGCDANAAAVDAARANCRQAGLDRWIRVERRRLSACRPPGSAPGLLVANPPYGERLDSRELLMPLYRQLGSLLSARFAGWRAAVLTTPELGQQLGIRARLSNTMYNGDLRCCLLRFELDDKTLTREKEWRARRQAENRAKNAPSLDHRTDKRGKDARDTGPGLPGTAAPAAPAPEHHAAPMRECSLEPPAAQKREPLSIPARGRPSGSAHAASTDGTERSAEVPAENDAAAFLRGAGRPTAGGLLDSAEMFANRLRKNRRTLGKWARRHGVDCYRLYDADLPEFNLAIDLYRGTELWVHAQEYRAPASVDPERARQRREAALETIAAVLNLTPDHLYYKLRQRQRGPQQYGRVRQNGIFHTVREGACRLLVNLSDYLDTGLFLDHRPTRSLIARLAPGRHFLNLFAYTATATVHAGVAGAASTTSIDLSAAYLDWARRNLELNGLEANLHRLVRADAVAWLKTAADEQRQHWDLIFLDPPTFSNSKATPEHLDIQRDHVAMISQAARLLRPGGVLIFSTNYQRFRLDEAALQPWHLVDITRQTIPRDFARRPRVHQCFQLET